MAEEPSSDKPPLEAFLERYWKDREAGSVRSLHEYFSDLAISADWVWLTGDAHDPTLWQIDRATGSVNAAIALPSAPHSAAATEGSVWVSLFPALSTNLAALASNLSPSLFSGSMASTDWAH